MTQNQPLTSSQRQLLSAVYSVTSKFDIVWHMLSRRMQVRVLNGEGLKVKAKLDEAFPEAQSRIEVTEDFDPMNTVGKFNVTED